MNRTAWTALLGGAAVVGPAAVLAATPPGPAEAFVPPQQPVVLTRTLVRDLANGKHIVTQRSWQLSFRRDGAGYAVDAALIDSRVEAPPELAALAQIERLRPDGALFPLALDAAGMIVAPQPGSSTAGHADARIGAARDAAAGSITRSALAPAQREQAQSLLAAVAAAAARGIAEWPVDVFVPRDGHREDRRDFDTGVGGAGSVTVVVDTHARSGESSLGRTSRRVVTRIGSDRRASEEQWALVPRAKFAPQ